jgi:dinuclear metal center YbgI/SA1388 family protein
MSASCRMIATAIEKMAPLELAESWDNVGLLVGNPGNKVKKVLLALDVTAAVIEEAAGMEAGLIISHHPFPFHAMKSVRTDSNAGALLAGLLKKDIAVYAAHTNLDVTAGGVNDVLAQALHLHDILPLRPATCSLVKIVTYVPAGHVETVWQAMAGAGAGHIGKYSQCGFRVAGTGTFLPGENAVPFIGEPHQLSSVEEVRIETIAPSSLADEIVRSLLNAHPYEEAAYDIYPLKNEWKTGGLGCVGNLKQPLPLSEFASKVKAALSLPGVRVAGDSGTTVRRVAVCGGAGMEVADAARLSGAQVLVTGDIRYHDAHDAMAGGLCLIDAGHFGTEIPVLMKLQRYLQDCSDGEGWDCQFDITRQQADIWQWF